MKIREALSPEEQTAYDEALYGDMAAFEIDETLSEEEQAQAMENLPTQMGGCEGESQNASDCRWRRRYTRSSAARWTPCTSASRATPHSRGRAKVKDCVAGKGLEYPGQEEAFSMYDERLAEIDAQVTYPWAELSEDEISAMSEAEMQALVSEPSR